MPGITNYSEAYRPGFPLTRHVLVVEAMRVSRLVGMVLDKVCRQPQQMYMVPQLTWSPNSFVLKTRRGLCYECVVVSYTIEVSIPFKFCPAARFGIVRDDMSIEVIRPL